MSKPDFQFEEAAMARGALRVAGVDEVGRGPLAGPVSAAAVILNPSAIPEGLNDSKKLSPARREALFDQLRDMAQVSVAHASVAEIEEMNILRAAHLAMTRAVAGLPERPDHLLIDGKLPPKGLNLSHEMLVKGDARSLSIAAASIAAKVCRDRIMVELSQQFPAYGWEHNAGYPTPQHKDALKSHGITPHHRRTFRPVHNILYQENPVTS